MRHTPFRFAAALALTAFAATALADGPALRARGWIVNPQGEVDGIVLSDRSTVRFSAETGRSVVRQVRMGERVDVSHDGMTLSVPRTGYTVDLGMSVGVHGGVPRFAPPIPVAERAVDGMTVSGGAARGTQRFTVQGTVAALTRTRGRVVDGLVIHGGITVRVPTHRGANLASLRPGERVTVEGTGVRGRYGIGMSALRVRDARGVDLLAQTTAPPARSSL